MKIFLRRKAQEMNKSNLVEEIKSTEPLKDFQINSQQEKLICAAEQG